jgi:hypothetical protein
MNSTVQVGVPFLFSDISDLLKRSLNATDAKNPDAVPTFSQVPNVYGEQVIDALGKLPEKR